MSNPEALYQRKSRMVHAVQWTGDVKALPRMFRNHRTGSTFKGRIVIDQRGLAVVKRGDITSGLRPGDWLLRDMDGNLEVMGNERFLAEYAEMVLEIGATTE